MRVISGSAKGYGLKAPRHMGLRPTPSRVKQAVFSSLAARIPDARVLELFAGTGAFAIESLSRGARSAVLVEKDGRAAALIEANLLKTHLGSKARLIRTDVRQAVEWLSHEGAVFDLIFADPPYEKGSPAATPPQRRPKHPRVPWMSWLLQSETLPLLLAPGGLLLIEHFKKEAVAESPNFRVARDFRFGDTVVTVFEPQD